MMFESMGQSWRAQMPKRDANYPGKELPSDKIRSGASTLRRKISFSASNGCKMQNAETYAQLHAEH